MNKQDFTKSRASAIGVSIAVILILSGCGVPAAVGRADGAPSDSPTSASYWKAKLTEFLTKNGDSPQGSAPYSEAETQTVASGKADAKWTQVVSRFPGVLRPSDAFVHWSAGPTDPDVKSCYVAAGATVDEGTDADGNTYPGFSGPDTVAYAQATFDCIYDRFPTRPTPPATTSQISYYYDYLTKFVVPCYRAHGAVVDPAPTRADFIAQHQPNHTGARWAPVQPSAGNGPNPTFDGKDAVCPLDGPGGAGL